MKSKKSLKEEKIKPQFLKTSSSKYIKNIFNFLTELEKLKGKKRRGWVIHKAKTPETTPEHIFHLAMLVWLLGKRKEINLEKAIKMALIHDISEVYAPDLTSYDAKAINEKKRITIKDVLSLKPIPGRPTTKQRKKLAKIKKILEAKAMKKLLKKLPPDLRAEINYLWLDYEDGLSRESRFVKQADKMINLFQAFEYFKEGRKIPIELWIRRAKEVIDEPALLKLLNEIEKELIKKTRKTR